MARLDPPSAFSRALGGLFHGAPNRRARRALGWKVSSTRPAGSSRRRVRPRLEVLEDRVVPAGVIDVTTTSDVPLNQLQPGEVTLRSAILQADDDTGTATDTIQLQPLTYTLSIANTAGHDVGDGQGDLNIVNNSHTDVIQGTTDVAGNPTTIIDQTVLDRVFQIVDPGATVIFKNLIIEGGQAQDDGGVNTPAGSTEAEGGGILDDGGNVTLSNVILEKNSADAANGNSASGGGIYVAQGGSLNVQASVIEADGAFGGGGSTSNPNGGPAQGGGIFSLGQTSIVNSSVSNNVVTGGGAVSTSEGSAGFAQGGGVFASSNLLTLENTDLNGNQVTGGNSGVLPGGSAEGGGLYFGNKGGATVTSCSLSGNTLQGGVGELATAVSPGAVGDVGGDAGGGGVFSEGQLKISESNLSGNSLTGGKGFLDDDQDSITGDIGGDADGGGVYAGGTTIITTSTLANNKLKGGMGDEISGSHNGNIGGSVAGGGLYLNGSGLTITASTLSGNTEEGGNNANGTAFPGFAEGGGGFIEGASASSSAAIVNSTIANNQAIGGTGTSTTLVAEGGGLFFDLQTNATLTNDTLTENDATPVGSGDGLGDGGGIFNPSFNTGSVTLVNTLAADNFALGGIGNDIDGAVSTGSGHNLIGDADGSTGFSAASGNLLGTSTNPINPHLGPLANNGGPTQTIALLPGSPAINAGTTSVTSTTGPFDQRGQGFARVVDGAIDIGAFEVQEQQLSPPGGGSSSTPSPAPPPALQTPPLLAFFDALLGGVETVNGNGTETVIDRIFGFPLFISTYDSAGNLESVTLLGINLTTLFESL